MKWKLYQCHFYIAAKGVEDIEDLRRSIDGNLTYSFGDEFVKIRSVSEMKNSRFGRVGMKNPNTKKVN